MATYKANIRWFEIPEIKMQLFLKQYNEFIAYMERHGCYPVYDGTFLERCDSNGNGKKTWVDDLKNSPEGIELKKALEEDNKNIRDLICSECGFVAKHEGALGGHMRFKHKR